MWHANTVQNKRFTLCPVSDSTEKYSISSPLRWLPQMPSVPMNLHLLRRQKPVNRKFLTSCTDRLCVWSSAILFLHLCCICLCTHKARKNIRDAEPKCVGALGSLLSNITSPHLHSSFISVVIHIYYFPSFLCIAWQCSTVLGLMAGEAGAAKWRSKGHNALLHIKSSPNNPLGRVFSQVPITKWRIFFFLLLRWIRSDFRVLISACHQVSEFLWVRFSSWQVPLGR